MLAFNDSGIPNDVILFIYMYAFTFSPTKSRITNKMYFNVYFI